MRLRHLSGHGKAKQTLFEQTDRSTEIYSKPATFSIETIAFGYNRAALSLWKNPEPDTLWCCSVWYSVFVSFNGHHHTQQLADGQSTSCSCVQEVSDDPRMQQAHFENLAWNTRCFKHTVNKTFKLKLSSILAFSGGYWVYLLLASS